VIENEQTNKKEFNEKIILKGKNLQKENNMIIDREADSRHLIGHDGVN